MLYDARHAPLAAIENDLACARHLESLDNASEVRNLARRVSIFCFRYGPARLNARGHRRKMGSGRTFTRNWMVEEAARRSARTAVRTFRTRPRGRFLWRIVLTTAPRARHGHRWNICGAWRSHRDLPRTVTNRRCFYGRWFGSGTSGESSDRVVHVGWSRRFSFVVVCCCRWTLGPHRPPTQKAGTSKQCRSILSGSIYSILTQLGN